jgi:uncharacterized protein
MSELHENLSCEILLTNSCNLRCDYCIAKEMPGPTLKIEIGRKAIDMFMHLAEGGKIVEFTFSGGEPLIAFPLLEEMASYAQKRAQEAGMQAKFTLKTNGTILNQAIIDFLKMYCMKVFVSIDGTAEVHDRHRQTNDGHGTHYVVQRNFSRLLQNKILCIASVAVHPESSSMVAENIQYLNGLGADRIDIGPVYGTVAWTSGDNLKLAKSLMDVASYMREINGRGNQLEVTPLHRESEHTGDVLSDRWGCHAASTNLAFLPNGQVAGCSALAMIVSRFPELVLGDVFDGLNQQAIDQLLQLTQATAEKRLACKGCNVANNCTGGCLAINYSTTGFAFIPPDLYCSTISAIPIAWNKAWGGIEAPSAIIK